MQGEVDFGQEKLPIISSAAYLMSLRKAFSVGGYLKLIFAWLARMYLFLKFTMRLYYKCISPACSKHPALVFD